MKHGATQRQDASGCSSTYDPVGYSPKLSFSHKQTSLFILVSLNTCQDWGRKPLTVMLFFKYPKQKLTKYVSISIVFFLVLIRCLY